jgi:hypothetical protein
MTRATKKLGSGATVVILLAAVVAGAMLLLWVTPHGIGLYYDSMTYMESAESLAAGRGLGQVRDGEFHPLVHYPPVYSLVLAGLDAASIDLRAGARAINALALGLVGALVGATVLRATRSLPLAAVGAAWVLLSTPVWAVFSWAMSEPIFLPLWLGSTLALDTYIHQPGRRRLLTAAILAGAGLLTRYVGATSIVAAAAVLIRAASRKQVTWTDVVTYVAVACGPTLLWLGRNQMVGGSITNRLLAVHFPSREVVRQGADTVLGWFGPSESIRSEEVVAAAGLALALALFLLLASTRRRQAPAALPSQLIDLHVLNAAVYLSAVLVSITLFDSKTPLDDRILIPAYLSLGIVLLASLRRAREGRPAAAAIIPAILLAASIARQVTLAEAAANALRTDGQGYAAARWRESETGHRLRELSPTIVYTNDTTAVYFIAGLPSTSIPTPGGIAGLEEMRSDLTRDGAVLAIFGSITQEFMQADQLTSGLTLAEDLQDGRIYILPR